MDVAQTFDFYKVPCDYYGNPRRVLHFSYFLKEDEEWDYNVAKKRANKLGWRVYRGKDFGGGFVAQCWSEIHAEKKIKEMLIKI